MDDKNVQINKRISWQEWVAYKEAISMYNTKTLKGTNLRFYINV
jgi:hypothetical protein